MCKAGQVSQQVGIWEAEVSREGGGQNEFCGGRKRGRSHCWGSATRMT